MSFSSHPNIRLICLISDDRSEHIASTLITVPLFLHMLPLKQETNAQKHPVWVEGAQIIGNKYFFIEQVLSLLSPCPTQKSILINLCSASPPAEGDKAQ